MLDLIIVAGGRATRLGGIDKPALVFDGRPLLLAAVDAGVALGIRHTVVVGYEGRLVLPADVWRATEEPRWGGPAAAIVAGLRRLGSLLGAGFGAADLIVVVAGDLLRPNEAIAALLAEAEPILDRYPEVDGALAVDSAGRLQPLLSVFRASSINQATTTWGAATNLSVRRLIESLVLADVPVDDHLLADIDTPDDAARAGIALPDTGL